MITCCFSRGWRTADYCVHSAGIFYNKDPMDEATSSYKFPQDKSSDEQICFHPRGSVSHFLRNTLGVRSELERKYSLQLMWLIHKKTTMSKLLEKSPLQYSKVRCLISIDPILHKISKCQNRATSKKLLHLHQQIADECDYILLQYKAFSDQTIFSDAFSWMKKFVFWLKFHWRLFLRVQLTISQHWLR